MEDKAKRTREIGALLRQTTSLNVLGEFLKSKGFPHSGTWETIVEKRLVALVSENQLSNDDLIELLRSVEEYGKQHVFLHTCPPEVAIELMERTRIHGILADLQLTQLLETPAVLDQPEQPTIVDVRWDAAKVDLSMTIKLVEQRVSTRQGALELLTDGRMVRVMETEKQRAVHTVKLHKTGLLEFRIASQTSSSRYEDEVHRIWRHFHPFFSYDFRDVSLSKAKNVMWQQREVWKDIYEYTNHWVRDESGSVVSAVTAGGKRGLSSNKAVGGALDYALEHDENAYCEGSNFWFKKSDKLSSDVHVLLSGQSNEFALPANCNKEDYDYVLKQLLFFNK